MFNSIMKARKEILKQSLQLKKEEEAQRREAEKKVKQQGIHWCYIPQAAQRMAIVTADDVIEIDQGDIKDFSNEKIATNPRPTLFQPEDLKTLRNCIIHPYHSIEKMNRTTNNTQTEIQKQIAMIQERRQSR